MQGKVERAHLLNLEKSQEQNLAQGALLLQWRQCGFCRPPRR